MTATAYGQSHINCALPRLNYRDCVSLLQGCLLPMRLNDARKQHIQSFVSVPASAVPDRRKSYSAAVIDGIKRKSRSFVGDSIVRKTDTRLSKEEDVVVCLPGARIEHVTERVEKIMGRGTGGSILVHVGTNNADKEGTTAIVEKYRNLLKKTKQARVGQIILSGILPVFGNRIHGYRNSKRMTVNWMVKRLCKEEEVGYVDL